LAADGTDYADRQAMMAYILRQSAMHISPLPASEQGAVRPYHVDCDSAKKPDGKMAARGDFAGERR